ncbi:MAG: peptidylprolyl isomerase, partial [Paracoccus sp. (in: a-proteobacteria)]
LVFPDLATAEAARARLDSGAVPFEALVAERGLSLDDIELGEVSAAALGGEAATAVCALEQPGVVGPFQTDLGPALFSMNAILDPVDISFEAARDELRGEAATDRAARMIQDLAGEIEDLLASGATLEDVAKESRMKLGQIDFDASAPPAPEGIDGYQAFRERAATVAEGDFPQLYQLDDGGVFALRLDQVVPPALRPFDEVADAVATDWIASETHGMLLARAEEEAAALQTGPSAPAPAAPSAPSAPSEQPGPEGAEAGDADAAATPQPAGQKAMALTRDGWIDGVPADLIAQAFTIPQPGETHVVDAQDRVFLVTLDAIHPVDMASPAAGDAAGRVRERLEQSLQNDLFDYFIRSVQAERGIQFNQSAIAAAQTMVQ